MIYTNLIIAQAVCAYVAAPFLVSLAFRPEHETFGPYFWYVVAGLGALIVFVTGFVGSRITKAIDRPDAGTLFLAAGFAIAGVFLATMTLAPKFEQGRIWGEIFTLTPVAAAIFGYMLHRGDEQF